VSAFRNETNIVKITSPEWQAWIAHGPSLSSQGGRKEIHRTDNQYFQASEERAKRGQIATASKYMHGREDNQQREHAAKGEEDEWPQLVAHRTTPKEMRRFCKPEISAAGRPSR
jgi:hypothetical protein